MALAVLLAFGGFACEDEDNVRVNAPSQPPPPPPPMPPHGGPGEMAPLPGLASGMVIHSVVSPDLCFDAKGNRAVPHTPIEVFSCHGRENQRWFLGGGPTGGTTITGIGGLCLDIHGARSRDGASAQLYPCNGGGNQEFKITPDGRIHEVANGECLTATGGAPGSRIVVAPCDAQNPGQAWTVTDH